MAYPTSIFLHRLHPVYSIIPSPTVKVETEFIRAADGVGYAKCGGNYGGALLPPTRQKPATTSMALTDAQNREFIEESAL